MDALINIEIWNSLWLLCNSNEFQNLGADPDLHLDVQFMMAIRAWNVPYETFKSFRVGHLLSFFRQPVSSPPKAPELSGKGPCRTSLPGFATDTLHLSFRISPSAKYCYADQVCLAQSDLCVCVMSWFASAFQLQLPRLTT